MNTIGHMLLAVMLGLSSLGQAGEAGKSPAVLLQEAIYQEQTAGDLDKAIELYGQVLEQAADVERLAARAAYQLGLCHLKKGDEAAAAGYFQKTVRNYPGQTSIVKKAQAELDKITPVDAEGILFEKLPDEVLLKIANMYSQTCSKATLKNLYANSHIHFVNADFVDFSGGYGYYTNQLNMPLTQKVRLSGTSYPNQSHYDIAGRKMNTEIVPDESLPNFYHIYWTPDEPLPPGQFFMYGWCGHQGSKLPMVPGMTGQDRRQKYTLTMQNHFGNHAFEVFYLVLPATLHIADMTEDCTDAQPAGDFTVYAWEKEVQPDENHKVTVHLSEKEASSAGTVILNDSFEEGSDGVPAGWEQGAAVEGVSYIWDKNTGSDGGTASLCLKKDVEKYFPIAQWTRKIDYTGDAKELTVSAQVRARKAYKAIIDALFLDDKGEWIKHEWVSYIGVKEAGDPPANHNWKLYAGTVEIPDNTKTIVIGLQMYGPGTVWFDELEAFYGNSAGGLDPQTLVEDFFKHNFKDITSRKTLEWGEPTIDENGHISIRYKFEGTIWGREKHIGNMLFTFDKDGKLLSHRDIPDTTTQEGVQQLVEKFFKSNYHDIKSRKTLEWGELTPNENGNVSIRYKYEGTVRDEGTIVKNQIFSFDKEGNFISVKDAM